MADAVVGDIDTHGPGAVATLAVSHADCEDLADRIRARLLDAGLIIGEAMVGPGWGRGERSYASGDRVLLHTKPGIDGLHNGSTGTVVGVGSNGLRVAFDDQDEVVLRADFVQGRRNDGNPNLSHAWARTVEGAQGGTWEAVHLLGSASLDALVGYTGQGRGRAPTHTWNTRPLAAVDHGGLAADDRSATEIVLASWSREPVTTFAAADDPWVLDGRLVAERDEHLAVLATAPPDRGRSLDDAGEAAYQTAFRHTAAADDLERARARVAGFGPLTGLRRSSRVERAQAEDWLSRAHDSLERTTSQRRAAQNRVVALEAGEEKRRWFWVEHAWRVERVKAIDAELARHWSAATLAAVRQDDPLAFGIERLRGARATYAGDLAELEQGLPPDRTDVLKRAEQEHGGAEYALRQARFAAKDRRRLSTSSRDVTGDAGTSRRWQRPFRGWSAPTSPWSPRWRRRRPPGADWTTNWLPSSAGHRRWRPKPRSGRS